MKRAIFLFTILSFISVTTSAQDIVKEEPYLKATNYLWYMTINFNKLKASQTEETKTTILPKVETALKCLNKELNELKISYNNDETFKKLEQWILVESKNVESLKGDNWLTEPTWQMGSLLIEMDLEDLINNKLCK